MALSLSLPLSCALDFLFIVAVLCGAVPGLFLVQSKRRVSSKPFPIVRMRSADGKRTSWKQLRNQREVPLEGAQVMFFMHRGATSRSLLAVCLCACVVAGKSLQEERQEWV